MRQMSKIVVQPLQGAKTYLRVWDFGRQKCGIFRFFIFFDLRANVFLCIHTYSIQREYVPTCNAIRCKNHGLKKMTEADVSPGWKDFVLYCTHPTNHKLIFASIFVQKKQRKWWGDDYLSNQWDAPCFIEYFSGILMEYFSVANVFLSTCPEQDNPII